MSDTVWLKEMGLSPYPFIATLYVTPTGKGRARATKQGRMFTPSETVNAEAEIKWLLRKENPPCATGPVHLRVSVYLKKPKSAKKRPFPITKPDADNILKLICDAANGILFEDDRQVCSVALTKEYGEPERIELYVDEMETPA